jgi:sugar/nucleoside kinase (ribokinase family)
MYGAHLGSVFMDIKYDILGLGHACLDIVSQVDDAFLTRWHIPKGEAVDVDRATAHAIETALDNPGYFPGGSAANTAACLAALGGRAAFIGKLAQDDIGARIRNDMQASNIALYTPCAAENCDSADPPGSTRVICLTTQHPHPERSFACYAGISQSLTPADLPDSLLAQSQLLHADGHILLHPGIADTLIDAAARAHNQQRRFAFTLADPSRLRSMPERLAQIIRLSDILLLNTPEALTLTGCSDLNAAVNTLQAMGKTGAVTCGAQGAFVYDKAQIIHVAAVPIHGTVIDPNGAGDAFAGGFLYGLLHGFPLAKAGFLGARCAATVLTRFGARVPNNLHALLEE